MTRAREVYYSVKFSRETDVKGTRKNRNQITGKAKKVTSIWNKY